MAGGRSAEGDRSEPGGTQDRSGPASSWALVPKTFRTGDGSLPPPWEDIFGPLRKGVIDDLVLVGQCGQSIDARIATLTGHSHYINSEAGLAHLHRLRALVDAVVIGVGTAIADDPLLTVRRVEGPNPARVIVDPTGRLPPTARVLAADGARRLVVTAAGARARFPAHPDRGRGRYSVAIPRRRLSRPPAYSGRSDHPGRRTIEPHAAADRARR